MRLAGSGAALRLQGFLVGGDISAETWLRPLLQDDLPAQAYGRSLLIAGAKAPVAIAPRGRQVCSCFNVSETEIDAALAEGRGTPQAQLDQLQLALRCGTNCGSCLPELRRMIRAHATPPVAAVQEAT
jgi:assimilatory nitrate reductase catalytic subunit